MTNIIPFPQPNQEVIRQFEEGLQIYKKEELEWQQLKKSGRQDYQLMGFKGITDRHWGRSMFFRTFKELVPEAIKDIHNMLPLYQILQIEIRIKNIEYEVFRFDPEWNLSDLWSMFHNEKQHHPFWMFFSVIEAWRIKYHFYPQDFWVYNEIPRILSSWIKDEREKLAETFTYTGTMDQEVRHKITEFVTKSENPKFVSPPLANPLKYTEKQYLEMCKKAFRKNQNLLNRMGLEKSKVKSKSELHFEWLVRFYVLNESFEDISKYDDTEKDYYRDPSGIGKRVRELIDLIGLTDKNKGSF